MAHQKQKKKRESGVRGPKSQKNVVTVAMVTKTLESQYLDSLVDFDKPHVFGVVNIQF